MKLCLDTRTATPHFPGIGRYVENLARSLPRFLEPGDELHRIANPQEKGHPVEGLGPIWHASASPFSLAQQWQIPALLRKIGADLYHSPYYLMPYRPGCRSVLTVYDLIPLRFPELVSARARLLFRLTTRLALASAQHIIAISEVTRQDTRHHFHLAPGRITTIPLAAGERYHPQSNQEQERVREQWNLPQVFGLYLGSNKPHKNLVRLVQAWKLLGPTAPPLIMAGAWDPEYPQAKRAVAQLGLESQVRFLGSVTENDLPGLYTAAACFVFPSLYEGFGLPVLEAMACGTPVACSRTSSLPEVAGEAASYFDPLLLTSIKEAVEAILLEPGRAQKLSLAGLDQAKNFSWERTARETVAVYRSCLA